MGGPWAALAFMRLGASSRVLVDRVVDRKFVAGFLVVLDEGAHDAGHVDALLRLHRLGALVGQALSFIAQAFLAEGEICLILTPAALSLAMPQS